MTRVLHLQKVAGISGSEAHLLSLLPRLRERGWDIRMLMLHEDEPGAWDFAGALEATGVPLDTMRLRADVDPLAFFELGAYLARRRPEILHTHLVHADAYGQMAGLLARVPVRFSTKHGFNEFREGRAFALGDRTVASLAHVHIAISRGLARYLAETEGFEEESFEIVHYGITPNGEPAPYAGAAPAAPLRRAADPDQGPHRAAARLRRRRRQLPGLELDIAGRGPLEPALRALARELGVADAVRFLGHVTPIQDAIERSAVVVVPSMGEGFGMVALEAMERARPVIAAEIGGLGELVRRRRDGSSGRAGRGRAAARGDRPSSPATWSWRRGWARPVATRALQRLPRGALHRPDGDPLPLGARLRESQASLTSASLVRPPQSARPSSRPRTRARARARPARPSLPLAPGRPATRDRPRERGGVVRRHEQSPSRRRRRSPARAHPRRHDRLRGQHRLQQRQTEALPARRVDEHSARRYQRRDVADPPGQVDAVPASPLLAPGPRRARPAPPRGSTLAHPRAPAPQRRRPSAARARDAEQHARVLRQPRPPGSRPTARAARRARSGRPRPSPPAARPLDGEASEAPPRSRSPAPRGASRSRST